MFTKAFWKDAAERAIKTFAQAFAALIVVVLGGEFDFSSGIVDVGSIPWSAIAATAGVAALLSLLSSVASAKIGVNGTEGSPSLVTPPVRGPELLK